MFEWRVGGLGGAFLVAKGAEFKPPCIVGCRLALETVGDPGLAQHPSLLVFAPWLRSRSLQVLEHVAPVYTEGFAGTPVLLIFLELGVVPSPS